MFFLLLNGNNNNNNADHIRIDSHIIYLWIQWTPAYLKSISAVSI